MRIIRTIVFILVCLGLIWLVVLLFSRVLSTSAPTVTTTSKLSNYANTASTATMTVDGPVRVDEEHKVIRISVDKSQTIIQLLSGYNGDIVRQDSFTNTVEGYEVFLRSLESLGYAKGNTTASQDERGQCPLQYRYIYQLTDGGKDIIRFWSTSCGTGTFNGSKESVRTLFQRQIPATTYANYSSDFTRRD